MLHPGKLALAYGKLMEQLMCYSRHDGVMDPTHAVGFGAHPPRQTTAFYPEITVSCGIKDPNVVGSVQMAEIGLVMKIDFQDISGSNVASTFMGISEHISAAQHAQSSSATNQRKVFKHHARCIDVLDGTEKPDRTVTIKPSNFLGRYTDQYGSELFPDPTAAGANPADILRSSIDRLTVHIKHERCPDPSVKEFFPSMELQYQLRVTQLTLSHLRRKAFWFLRSWLPHHLNHDIIELIVILRYPHIDKSKLELKANINVWNLSNL
jgi:hypothetical protein